MTKLPPRKLPSTDRRDREFLYLHEVDALITASRQTRAPIRNQALVMLLFCQALQPSEICWLRWCDLNSTANSLLVIRNQFQIPPHPTASCGQPTAFVSCGN
ncbi:hypothetical protein [Chlorogloea sp. CCALA 695]|uniref:hypothetical protein n=1 Tax=Chlorogloea sp. CCALA 695 TaxID=2107693 RepID=UPI0018EC0648|nr:hypothetical protein [Chlorogloea sp. CCALA 695]